MERGNIKISIEKGKAPSIEAQLVNGNLWLTKNEISKLFNCFPQKIEANLRSIFKEKLLWESEVSQNYRYTDKGIEKQAVYYNLEVLICLTYRINTAEAAVFRKFVNSTLRERLQKKKIEKEPQILWYFIPKQSSIWN